LKQDNNSQKKSEPTSKQAKPRGPVRRDTKEVVAELVEKLKENWIRKRWQQRAPEKSICAVSLESRELFAAVRFLEW
jgi:hypothetical protein